MTTTKWFIFFLTLYLLVVISDVLGATIGLTIFLLSTSTIYILFFLCYIIWLFKNNPFTQTRKKKILTIATIIISILLLLNSISFLTHYLIKPTKLTVISKIETWLLMKKNEEIYVEDIGLECNTKEFSKSIFILDSPEIYNNNCNTSIKPNIDFTKNSIAHIAFPYGDCDEFETRVFKNNLTKTITVRTNVFHHSGICTMRLNFESSSFLIPYSSQDYTIKTEFESTIN